MTLKDWYFGLVSSMDKAEFKEDEHPRGKGGMFVKKGEGGGSDGVAGKVSAYREKHEAFSKELLKDLNSPVAEKMRDELQSMLSELDGMGVDVERLGVGKDDKIPMKADKAEFKKGEGGGGSSALEEAYKKGGFKHPEELAKADFEELGKMNDSRLDAEITMLKGKVEEGGKPLDKARLEAAEGIMKGRGVKKVDEPTLKFKKGDKVKVPNREGVHEITGIVDSMYGGKLYEVDNDHSVGYSESEISNTKK